MQLLKSATVRSTAITGGILLYGMYAVNSVTPVERLHSIGEAITNCLPILPMTALAWSMVPQAFKINRMKRKEQPSDDWKITNPGIGATVYTSLIVLGTETLLALKYPGNERTIGQPHIATLGLTLFPLIYQVLTGLRIFKPPYLQNLRKVLESMIQTDTNPQNPEETIIQTVALDDVVQLAEATQMAKQGNIETALARIEEIHLPTTRFDNMLTQITTKAITELNAQDEYKKKPENPIPLIQLQELYLQLKQKTEIKQTSDQILKDHFGNDGILAFQAQILEQAGIENNLMEELIRRLTNYAPSKTYKSSKNRVYTLNAGTYLRGKFIMKAGQLREEWEKTKEAKKAIGALSVKPVAFTTKNEDYLLLGLINGMPLPQEHTGEALQALSLLSKKTNPEKFPLIDYERIFYTAAKRIGISPKKTNAFQKLKNNRVIHNNPCPENILWNNTPVILDYEDSGRGDEILDKAQLLACYGTTKAKQYQNKRRFAIANLLATMRLLGRQHEYDEGNRELLEKHLRDACENIKPYYPELCFT
ncbi:hypothetical protein HY486_00290 [Candidatus Woesearchaeota archaeon]|nr:hypothetical protein [Candidatus Woesearchaeota archaeon]